MKGNYIMKIDVCSKKEQDYIIERLVEYNLSQVEAKQKENFIDLHNEGLSISEIAARFKLSGSTVYRYLDEIAKENGTSREDLLQKSLYHTQAERLRREEKEAKASFEKVQKELAVLQNSLQIVRSLVDNVKESIMTYEKIEQEEYEDAKN